MSWNDRRIAVTRYSYGLMFPQIRRTKYFIAQYRSEMHAVPPNTNLRRMIIAIEKTYRNGIILQRPDKHHRPTVHGNSLYRFCQWILIDRDHVGIHQNRFRLIAHVGHVIS